jgi:hypothetical protein
VSHAHVFTTVCNVLTVRGAPSSSSTIPATNRESAMLALDAPWATAGVVNHR